MEEEQVDTIEDEEKPDQEGGGEPSPVEEIKSLAREKVKEQAKEKIKKEAGQKLATSILSNPYVILIALAVIVFIVIIMIVVGLFLYHSEEGQTSTSGIATNISGAQLKLETPPNLGSADSKGYYLLPKSDVYGGYYGGSYDCNKKGSKTLIEVVYTVAKYYGEGRSKYFVGDLNSSGHITHSTGVDVDIDLPSGMMVDGSSYKREWAIEAAKLFFKTGTIRWIYYDDPKVVDIVNKWAKENNLPGEMKVIGGHGNHFHVRIDLKYELSSFSPRCSGSSG